MKSIKSTLFVTTLISLLCISAIAQTNPPAPPGQPAGTNVPAPIHVPSFNGVLGPNQVLFTSEKATPTNGGLTEFVFTLTNTIPTSNYLVMRSSKAEGPYIGFQLFTATNTTQILKYVIDTDVQPIRFLRVVSQ